MTQMALLVCLLMSSFSAVMAENGTEMTNTPCEIRHCFEDFYSDLKNSFTNVNAEVEIETFCPEGMYSVLCAIEKLSDCNSEGTAASSKYSGLKNLLLDLELMVYDFCSEENNSTKEAELMSTSCQLQECFQNWLSKANEFFRSISAEEGLETFCPDAVYFFNCTREKLSNCNRKLSEEPSKHDKLIQRYEAITLEFCRDENNLSLGSYEDSKNKSSRQSAARFITTPFLKLLFYSSKNMSRLEIIPSHNIKIWQPRSNFNPTLPTFIIIHGYLPVTGDWQWRLETELQSYKKCNVFIVDWEVGATTFYWLAKANMKNIGRKVGEFIINLERRFPTTLRSVHIIGYSLGAHAAGFAGKKVRKELNALVNRITGLDPAGPSFRDKPSSRRLDKTDAKFVDVIHTNGADNILKGFGIKEAVGHINFYPNGGQIQTGCKTPSEAFSNFKEQMKSISSKNLYDTMLKIIPGLIKDEVTTLIQDLSCSHSRATELFISSVNSCNFTSLICDNWETNSLKNCKNESSEVKMGFGADENITLTTSPMKLYLNTRDSYPYC